MSPETSNVQGLVLRNTVFMLVAQALSTPLSVVVSAVMARYLGAKDYGNLYLATTFASFAFIAVEWGQSGAIPSMVARERTRAAELLGTGLVWRGCISIVALGVFVLLAPILGWQREFEIALILVVVGSAIGTLNATCHETIRGFERTDITLYAGVAQNFVGALVVVATLMLGGRLNATLVAQASIGVVILGFLWAALRKMGVRRPSFRAATLRELLATGSPFVLFAVAMVLQPNVDAMFMSRLAPIEAVGWLAAARKLVGVLVYPASALTYALYPTLCRLQNEDAEAFGRTLAGALRIATILVIPVALGCALYPGLGVSIFSRKQYGPAQDDLRVMAAFVLLVYFTMILGIGLLAAGRQRSWAVVQLLCVLVSLCVDPLLIPWFQTHQGNGGLGVCIANLASEVLMVAGGVLLAPRGVFGRPFLRALALAALAGGVMAALSRVLTGVPPLVSALTSVLAYFGALLAMGGLDVKELKLVLDVFARKFARGRPTSPDDSQVATDKLPGQ